MPLTDFVWEPEPVMVTMMDGADEIQECFVGTAKDEDGNIVHVCAPVTTLQRMHKQHH